MSPSACFAWGVPNLGTCRNAWQRSCRRPTSAPRCPQRHSPNHNTPSVLSQTAFNQSI